MQPSTLDPLTEEPQYSDGRDPESSEPTSPWGWPTEVATSGEPVSFAVAQIVITIEEVPLSEAEEVYGRSVQAFPEWFERLKDWIEVLNHQDLDYVAPRKRMEVEGHGWTAWHGTNELGWFRRHGHIYIDFDYGEPLTLQRWKRLLELAKAGCEPATEYLLLRDARAAHVRDRYRQSVIDSATALEIALYRLLAIENESAPSALGSLLIDAAKGWTLGSLLAVARRLPSLPASVTDASVQLRNKVVHKTARQPTEAESAAILAAAADAVSAALPRDDMLQNALAAAQTPLV